MLLQIPLVLFIISSLPILSLARLKLGFYNNPCPNAEAIVTTIVRQASLTDPTIPAALVRLHYHDCIVQGCDGSVLIDTQMEDGPPEKLSPGHAGLRGFDVIERAKAALEAECPGVVSCADIIALAARDSIALSKGPFYQVPTGRRDGRVSRASDAASMPGIEDSVAVLRAKFAEKGLSEKDLVLLTAAHTIGTTACFFLEKRLYDFSPVFRSDPRINPFFLPELQARCPINGDPNARLPLDRGSEMVFDLQILSNIRSGFAAIESDAVMYTEATTRGIIDAYLGFVDPVTGPFFERDFVGAMVRMGVVGVRTGEEEGEIRRVCSAFN